MKNFFMTIKKKVKSMLNLDSADTDANPIPEAELTRAPDTGALQIGDYIFSSQTPIDQDQFLTIFKVYHSSDPSTPYILKSLSKNLATSDPNLKRRAIDNERSIMLQFNSPLITKVHAAFQTPKSYLLVTDYYPKGNLLTHLRQNGPLPEAQAIHYLGRISEAFFLLKTKNIIHKNFGPEALYLNGDSIAIGGFYSAGSGTEHEPDTFSGNSKSMAPELRVADKCTDACDLYGIGVTFYYMLYGKSPWDSELKSGNDTSKRGECSGQNLAFGDGKREVSDASKDLLRRLIEPSLEHRIGWDMFRSHRVMVNKIRFFWLLQAMFEDKGIWGPPQWNEISDLLVP
jgi:serine/threonine protein kinase